MPRDDDTRTFDVNKPNRYSPTASSRPVIVGHHPVISDPMISEGRQFRHPSPPHGPKVTAVPVKDEDSQPAVPRPYFRTDRAQLEPEPPAHRQPEAKAEAVEPDPFEVAQMPVTHDTQTNVPPGVINPTDSRSFKHIPLPPTVGSKPRRSKITKIILIVLVVLVAAYLVLDSRLIKTNINLPFHIFKQPAPAAPASIASNSNQSSTTSQSTIPSGFSQYQASTVPFSFDYPTAWGAPVTIEEQGYSQRGGSNNSDGTYAYIIGFATNKNIQVTATSSNLLPIKRTSPTYYDFLQWCVGTNDNKIYKSRLLFTTSGGVDTPSTTVCDQGPLTDATKIDNQTIVQVNTKNPDGTALGTLYTVNVASTVSSNYSVIRVKDAAGTNGTDVQKLLSTIEFPSAN